MLYQHSEKQYCVHLNIPVEIPENIVWQFQQPQVSSSYQIVKISNINKFKASSSSAAGFLGLWDFCNAFYETTASGGSTQL